MMKSITLTAIVCFFALAGKCQQADSMQPVKRKEDGTLLFTKVEKEAVFPGGLSAWVKYLQTNLNVDAATRKAKAGRYTVTVQFRVDREGNISEVKAVEEPKGCRYCAAEAVRVIAEGPKWKPAEQGGRTVIYQARQKITFAVE